MSLMVELAGFLAGMISEYAQQKRWGSFKVFIVTFSLFFTLFALYVLLFPSERGVWVGLSVATALGGGDRVGQCSPAAIWQAP